MKNAHVEQMISGDRDGTPQKGLQDSSSPFKSVNGKNKNLVNASPVVLVKKKGSAKYSQRKSSNVASV